MMVVRLIKVGCGEALYSLRCTPIPHKVYGASGVWGITITYVTLFFKIFHEHQFITMFDLFLKNVNTNYI